MGKLRRPAFEEAEKEKKPSIKNAFEGVWEELTEEQRGHVEELKDILVRYPKEYDLGSFEGGLKGLDDLLEKKK